METEGLGTEQRALKEAEEWRVWAETCGEKWREVEAQINGILQDGQNAGRRLTELFADHAFWLPYLMKLDAAARLGVLEQIYEREAANGVEHTVLEHGKTVAELLAYMDELKFLLYRVDFAADAEAEQDLLAFLKENDVSADMLALMLDTNAIRRRELAVKLEKIFEKRGMLRKQFAMIVFLNDRFPAAIPYLEKEEKLLEAVGRTEKAADVRARLEEYRKPGLAWRTVAEIQTELWNLKYDRDRHTDRLLRLIAESGMDKGAWKRLLLLEGKCGEDFYCKIGNALLDEGMAELCRGVLEAAAETGETEKSDGEQ